MTGLGITGLAIGLAAQETLSSVFGSISIMSDKVYKLGDYIYVNGVEGTVEAINFHSTKIRTTDNILVTIPNNIPADNIVKTRTTTCKRVLNEFFDIEYGTSDENIQKAKNIIVKACENNDKIDSNCNVFISKLAESAITLQLYSNTKTTKWIDFMNVRDQLFTEIIKQYREHGINFAFPSKTVYLRNDDEN
jgi:MscS family membrane protein